MEFRDCLSRNHEAHEDTREIVINPVQNKRASRDCDAPLLHRSGSPSNSRRPAVIRSATCTDLRQWLYRPAAVCFSRKSTKPKTAEFAAAHDFVVALTVSSEAIVRRPD